MNTITENHLTRMTGENTRDFFKPQTHKYGKQIRPFFSFIQSIKKNIYLFLNFTFQLQHTFSINLYLFLGV